VWLRDEERECGWDVFPVERRPFKMMGAAAVFLPCSTSSLC